MTEVMIAKGISNQRKMMSTKNDATKMRKLPKRVRKRSRGISPRRYGWVCKCEGDFRPKVWSPSHHLVCKSKSKENLSQLIFNGTLYDELSVIYNLIITLSLIHI